MQIVIDIDKESYEHIKAYTNEEVLPIGWYSIINGKPLPKGHGRLMILSEDKLKENQINLDSSCQKWISEVGLSNAIVTIIEADKESEVEE